MESDTTVAVVERAWIERQETGRWKVLYSTAGRNGYEETERLKAKNIPNRERAKEIANAFQGTDLKPDHFIP